MSVDEKQFIDNFIDTMCPEPEGSPKYPFEILRIRGFLIDEDSKGNFSLCGFSTEKDKDHYSEMISSGITKETLYKLFERGGTQNHMVGWNPKWAKWQRLFASSRVYGEKVDVFSLEPFVARYCKALATIGVHTFYSCDGWHKDRLDPLRIVFSERYSTQWIRVLNDFYPMTNLPFEQCSRFDDYELFDNRELRVSFGNDVCQRLAVYKDINSVAKCLYANREHLQKLKAAVIARLKGIPSITITRMSDQQIYNILSNAYNEVIEASGLYRGMAK